MFIQHCFIRKNTKELRDRLEKLGYKICKCCEFEDAIWLNNYIPTSSIHGIGYSDKEIGTSVKESLNLFLEENNNYIDCKENEELFLAIAALRDDTDINQWFTDLSGHWEKCTFNEGYKFIWFNYNLNIRNAYKATVKELIKHFNK